MNRNRLGRLACVLCVLCAVLAQAAAGRAEDKRSLPFNKQSVYSYFRQVEEGRRGLPEDLPPEALQAKFCQLYVSVLKRSGYDFEVTIQNAVQFADRATASSTTRAFFSGRGVPDASGRVFAPGAHLQGHPGRRHELPALGAGALRSGCRPAARPAAGIGLSLKLTVGGCWRRQPG
jgi:hypothetical protein